MRPAQSTPAVPRFAPWLLVLGLALTGCRSGPAPWPTEVPIDLQLELGPGQGPRTGEGSRLVGELRVTVSITAEGPELPEAELRTLVTEQLVAALEERLKGQDLVDLDVQGVLRGEGEKALSSVGLRLHSVGESTLGWPGAERRTLLEPTTDTKLLILGLDGLDWDIVDPLLEQGKMPALQGLIDRGTRAKLATIQPILSPVIWTSMATSREPADHGILDFLGEDATGQPVPVTSNLRKTKAFWNVLSEAGVSVGVVAWWATWPAEAVNGFLVSDRVAYQLFGIDDEDLPPSGKVYPPALWNQVAPMVVRPQQVSNAEVARYLGPAGLTGLSPGDAQLVETFRSHLAGQRTYASISLKLHEQEQPRVGAYYFQATDQAAHLFMKYAPPRLPEVDEDRFARFSPVVSRVYEHHDKIVGQFLDSVDDNTVVMVVADHGFKSGKERPRSSSHVETGTAGEWHTHFGVFVAAGPGIRQGHEIKEASIKDIFPTALRLLGMPIAEDLTGRVLEEALTTDFLAESEPRSVLTFETSDEDDGKAKYAVASDEDRAIIDSLMAIGYLGSSKTESSDSSGGATEAERLSVGANAHNNLGLIALSQGDLDTAEVEFRAALEGEPGFVGARVNLAQTLLAKGGAEEAEALLSSLLDAEHGSGVGKALSLASELKRQAGDYELAEELARKAVADDDRSPRGWMQLGRVHESKQELEEARKCYLEVVELRPEDPQSRNSLGNTYQSAGDFVTAASWYEKAIDADPHFGPGYNNLALQYQRLGRMDEARGVYEKALLKIPDSSILLNNFATFYHLQGRALLRTRQGPRTKEQYATLMGKAAEIYQQAMDSNPLDPSPINNLGGLKKELGDLQAAQELFEEAVALDPHYVDALYNLGLLHCHRFRVAKDEGRKAALLHEAHAVLSRVLVEDPDHPGALRYDTATLSLLGRRAEAREQLEAAILRRPDSPDLQEALAALHEDEGNASEACALYRKALTLRGNPALEQKIAALCKE